MGNRTVSLANWIDAGGDYRFLRPGRQYARKPLVSPNLHLTTEAIQKRYSDLIGSTPDEGIAVFLNATVIEAGWIVTSSGEVIEESLEKPRNIFDQEIDPLAEPQARYDEAILFCKRGAQNYGHFLVEMLPRLILNKANLPQSPILILVRSKEFALPILEAAGFDLRLFKANSRRPVRVKKLWWPTRNSYHPLNTSPYAIKALQELRDRMVGQQMPKDRIFVSRRDAQTRQLLNDERVFASLSPLGFRWIKPGEMSFKEQVTAFSQAATVVAVCGAALTNMVFMKPGTKVVMLSPSTAAGFWFWDLAHHAGIEFSAVFGENESGSVANKNANFSIDVGDLHMVLNS